MSESRNHQNLVQIAVKCIIENVPVRDSALIQIDSPDTTRPMKIGNYIPDIYLETPNYLVIGEAKTLDDFDRIHSRNQYDAYLSKCSSFQGKSFFILSVPWQIVPSAKNYFRRIKLNRKIDVEIVVINELGKVAIV